MTINIAELNLVGAADFAAAVGDTFERAPWVAEAVAGKRPFATVAEMHSAMMGMIRAAPRDRQLAFLRDHPDLAGKAARAGDVTADSRREQASAGLDTLSEEEFSRFHRLNDAYRQKFGFPFILAVKGRTKDEILAAFEERLAHEPEQEFDTALAEIEQIAHLRLKDRLPSLPNTSAAIE